jgi:RimJ/RimL family protein N-acetyltransferase
MLAAPNASDRSMLPAHSFNVTPAASRHAPSDTRLPDGTAIRFRPIQPTDADHLIELFNQLSDRSRYRRFLSPITRLSEKQLESFTQVDHINHVAWVAELSDHPDRPVVGVGRWIRLEPDRTVAEFALTVVDAFQGHGLGRMLLRLLARSAVTRGISTFHANVLAENQPMVALLRSSGARQVGLDFGVYEYRVPVSSVLEQVRASA